MGLSDLDQKHPAAMGVAASQVKKATGEDLFDAPMNAVDMHHAETEAEKMCSIFYSIPFHLFESSFD